MMLPCIFISRTSLLCAIDHVSYLILTIDQQAIQRKTYFSFAGEETGVRGSGSFSGK